MPRMPSDKKAQAEKLFNKGMKLTDIANKLGIPEGTVRSWKNRGKWGTKASKKNDCNVADDATGNATPQKRKRGAPKGNQNAKGARGNPNPVPPPDATKHGAYRAVIADALDEDEQELYDMVPDDEEVLLMEEIRFFSIRERRILQAINIYRNQKGDVAISDVNRSETKRAFKDDGEKELYERRIEEKVSKGDRLPGETYSLETHTTNKYYIIARLEQELSSIQNKKTKAIEALSKIRMERARMKNEQSGSSIADDWIAAVLGGAGDEG